MGIRALLLVMVGLSIGCGYVVSGRWEDDPKNWDRAFHSTKPKDVVVVHSEYWRDPHWSYEAGYAFEIRGNEALREQLFRENHLSQVPSRELENVGAVCGSCPTWFAPGPLSQYDVWRYSDEPASNFRVLVNRDTGDMFLVDYQL